MSKPRFLAVFFALSLLPACSIRFGDWGGPDVWVEETDNFTISAADLDSLSCKTHNGRIAVEGREGSDQVEVSVHKRAGGDDLEDAKAAMAALLIINEEHQGELELGWKWREGQDSGWRAGVSFDIAQPSRLAVRVGTHNGPISMENVAGSCQAQTHNGRIEVASSGDRVKLESHNGGIIANLDAQHSIGGTITSHNGSVLVDLADAVSAQVRCSTHNGGISSELSLTDSFRGRNFLSGDLGGGGSKLDITTHNGSIRLR